MYIIQHPSPNFNTRSGDIKAVVWHSTGGTNSLALLCDPTAAVSAHYLIEKNGTIYHLVDESKRAWHAGVGEVPGYPGEDPNDITIGIELENSNSGSDPYPETQLAAAVELAQDINARRGFTREEHVTHKAVAPGRKIDPVGLAFSAFLDRIFETAVPDPVVPDPVVPDPPEPTLPAGYGLAYSRNGGGTWTQDTAGLPGGSWSAIRRALRLRYTGGSAGLYVASGAAWTAISGVSSVSALSPITGSDSNEIIVGSSDGHLYQVRETTIEKTQMIEGAAIQSLARDTALTSLVLIGTSAGLYKSLDDLETVGILSFPGISVPAVDILRDPGAGEGAILLPVSGTVEVSGIWHYTTGIGWVRKNGTGAGALPANMAWVKVVADLFHRDRWVALCNSPNGGIYEYNGTQVICAGSAPAPISPLWITEDAGATWAPIVINMQSHIWFIDGSMQNWTLAEINDMEFDRRGVRGLFVLGSARTDDGHRHAMAWYGVGTAIYANLLASGTARSNTTLNAAGRLSSEAESFYSGEGGPDGGVIAITNNDGGFYKEIPMITEFTDPGIAKVNRNPGGVELSVDPGFTQLERRPLFGSFAIAVIVRGQDNRGTFYSLYGTSDYTSIPLALLTRVDLRFRNGPDMWVGATLVGQTVHTSITYAIDALYCGGGMGVVSLADPFTSEASETYRPDIFFTEVRCDRQWRKIVAAMAYVERQIHIKLATGWSIIPIPAGVEIHTGAGMEVIGL